MKEESYIIQLIKFGLIGVLNTLITVGSYNLLVLIDVNYIIANIMGYVLGTINSYFWNKSWVFKSREAHKDLFFKFVLVNLLTLGINSLVLYLAVDKLNISKLIGQLIATFVGLLINFTLNKLWTFKEGTKE